MRTNQLALRVVLLLSLLAFLATPVCQAQQEAQQTRLTKYVDPFVGTGGHGHTFPGATRPFGMVQLSPDTRLEGWDGCSGYHYSDDIVYGFSHTHLSGTGISDYGDILLMPTAGKVFLDAFQEGKSERGYASRFSHQDETATPGFYAVHLRDDNIRVELTATERVGFHRYTFPRTSAANVIVDLVHRDRVIDSQLKVLSPTRLAGFRRSRAWARDQVVYFVIEFSKPFTAHGISTGGKLKDDLKEADGVDLKSYFRFDATKGEPLLVRVALSTVGIDGARKNLEAELNHWDFDRVRSNSDDAWNRELSRIEVRGGTRDQMVNFYTSLYHSMIAPNLFMDVDGHYRGVDGKVHRAEGFNNYTVFSLWDTFRAAHPLYTIIDRKRSADFIRTFLAQYEQGGRLPVWELAGNETDTMIGYHAVSVIADAATKNIVGFDLNHAFKAMKHSARLKHYGLAAYTKRGYISAEDEPEGVSKTLEYAYDDWCIAEVARLLRNDEDYREFTARAQSYKNLFDPETGFMRAKKNGNWIDPFDPREVNFSFTEANSWQYSFFAPHDVNGLIELMGGRARFTQKLDELFETDSRTTGRNQADITGLIGQYAHGNEPSHHMAYLFSYAGQPWKTQRRVRQILDTMYRPTPDGLIGNEDCGQMSAWFVLSAAGFYPVTPGATTYIIGSPLFSETKFNLENGKSFVIRARNVSARNIYIQTATLNSKPYRKSYLAHGDIANGGELVFMMGPRPSRSWGSRETDLPASRIEGQEIVPVPVIRANGPTFRGELPITLKPTISDLKIFYTTDGGEPRFDSTRYREPFLITKPTVVKAIAVDGRGVRSSVVEASFHRISHDWTISLRSKYAPQYSAGGDMALIDGLRGGANFRTGAWQGFQGQNFEALIDLGKLQTVGRLGAGFLQDVGSWILLPSKVEFELSTDGVNFEKALSIPNEVSDRKEEVVVKDFSDTVSERRARFVRIKAYNYGTLPAWHAGAGRQAWIFVDEILID